MDRDLRRLVVVAVVCLIVLFTGRAVISALYDDAEVMRQAAALRGQLRPGSSAGERPQRAELTAVAELRDELTAELERLVPAMDYELPAAFDVRPGESPDLRYIEIVRREQELLVKGAAFVGRSVPSNLGMPDLNPTGLEDVLRTLRSLHVVHVVVSAGLDAGIDAVDEIRIPSAGRTVRVETGFVRTHRVEFDLRGTPAAVRDALATIATGTPWLALDDVRLDALDDDGARVRCRFSAVAVMLDPEQAVLRDGRS
jgi:hypothetical protein